MQYLVARLSIDLERLEKSLRVSDRSIYYQYRKNAHKSCKNALKKSNKYAPCRIAVLRLAGQFYWLLNRQNRAVKIWKKAISEGERMAAHPDLARTYMEIGKRLHANNRNHQSLDGLSAEEYLEKAKILFQSMDLQWDLDALEKIGQTV